MNESDYVVTRLLDEAGLAALAAEAWECARSALPFFIDAVPPDGQEGQ